MTMLRRGCSPSHNTLCQRVPAALVASILITVAAAAQESQQSAPSPNGPSLLRIWRDVPADSIRGDVTARLRRITLADAQHLAQGANDALKRLGELQVEAARQHRLGVTSMYFPSVATQFLDFRLSEEPGVLLTLQQPLTGAAISVPITVIFQTQTAFNVVAAQPITQLFAVRQLVHIARADENIARAKAGLPVAAISRQVEKNFFDLLVAE